MKSKLILVILILNILPVALATQGAVLDDVSGLNNTSIHKLEKPTSLKELQNIVKTANKQQLKISIAGSRHSQGGHILLKDAIVIDMKAFNKILKLDKQNKIISVQAGATWEKVQDYLNNVGLAVKVQQSSNVFTVGGSLGANIHGRDPRFGTMIETVKGFHLIKHDGQLVYISRTSDPKLFSLVIGGYGLFGIITDVDMEVTTNDILKKESEKINCLEYPNFVKNHILSSSNIQLHYARPNITKKKLFSDCTVTSFSKIASNSNQLSKLDKEKMVATSKWLFHLSRQSEWGKKFRWFLQEQIFDKPGKVEILSRNNAMRPPIKFLEYHSKVDTDILQEYFIPISETNAFMEQLKKIILDDKINMLSITLRLVHVPDNAFLSYANGNEDKIAFVLYINHKKSKAEIEKVSQWTQKMVNLAIKHKGTYYLTYSLYPTETQIKSAYPTFPEFLKEKLQYDPNELFVNKFYEHYK